MPTTVEYLTLVRGEGEAWPLVVYNADGTAATGVFQGTETLTASIYYGADAALPVVPTATWIDGPSAQYLLSVTDAQSAALPPGPYTIVVEEASGSFSSPLLKVTLVVEAAPTGDGLGLRSLAQPGDLLALIPDQAQNAAVGAALEGATRAVEAYCRRPLVLGGYDRMFRPGRTRRIYLTAWPVQTLDALTTDLASAGQLTVAGVSTVQSARVTMTPVPGTQQVESIALTAVASGVTTTHTFTLPDYATILALTADIAATAGPTWAVISPGYASTANYQDMQLLPPSRLLYQAGGQGALARQVSLWVHATELADYVLDPRTGVVEIDQNRPEAFRYPDRAFGFGYGFAWSGANQPRHAEVRATWRAGYAIAQADLAAGYDPVPADLKMATCLTAQAILSAPTPVGAVRQQSVSGQELIFRNDASVVPLSARMLLRDYVSAREGGWGF